MFILFVSNKKCDLMGFSTREIIKVCFLFCRNGINCLIAKMLYEKETTQAYLSFILSSKSNSIVKFPNAENISLIDKDKL